MTLLSPRPNQISAIGSSAIDGNGLNIDVRISSKSAPIRVALAKAVKQTGENKPERHSPSSGATIVKDNRARQLARCNRRRTGSDRVGERRKQQRIVEPSRIELPRPRQDPASNSAFLKAPLSHMRRASSGSAPVEEHFVDVVPHRRSGCRLQPSHGRDEDSTEECVCRAESLPESSASQTEP